MKGCVAVVFWGDATVSEGILRKCTGVRGKAYLNCAAAIAYSDDFSLLRFGTLYV